MKPDLKLLTPELKAKVEAKMRECYKIAEKHYKKKYEFPEVRYDIRSWTGGLAYRDRNLIRFNLILLVENEADFIATTVPHEVAHKIVRATFKVPEGRKRIMPHGKEWKEVMGVLGVQPAVKHHYDCSSIEKSKRLPKAKNPTPRVDRLLARISNWTPEELHKIRTSI